METPSYSDDSYAGKFLQGYSIFPDDARIFHRAERAAARAFRLRRRFLPDLHGGADDVVALAHK